MDRIWLKQYPPGVPAEIDVGEYASIRDVFDESVARYASRPAFTCLGKSITFGELDTLSAAFGAWLQGIGGGKGSRVALMSGWGTVIVAELVAADAGLGAHLIAVQQSYDVSAVVGTMICFGASGFVMNALFTLLERRLMPWRTQERGS